MNFVFSDVHVEKLFKNDQFHSDIKNEWESDPGRVYGIQGNYSNQSMRAKVRPER